MKHPQGSNGVLVSRATKDMDHMESSGVALTFIIRVDK